MKRNQLTSNTSRSIKRYANQQKLTTLMKSSKNVLMTAEKHGNYLTLQLTEQKKQAPYLTYLTSITN